MQKERVEAEIAQGPLGSYLHDLGKILYFRDDYVLSNLVVLKPNWVTKAISHLLEDNGVRAAQGILTHLNFLISGLPTKRDVPMPLISTQSFYA